MSTLVEKVGSRRSAIGSEQSLVFYSLVYSNDHQLQTEDCPLHPEAPGYQLLVNRHNKCHNMELLILVLITTPKLLKDFITIKIR